MEEKLLTTTNKELLLKDLCARLPYEVKIEITEFSDYTGEKLNPKTRTVNFFLLGKLSAIAKGYSNNIIVPYLFPLSSITEEQKEKLENELIFPNNSNGGWIEILCNDKFEIPYWFVDFCNKNHFDYRGLIEKGLAIDATGLDIY